MKIVFCTTSKGRAFHLAETLPKNLKDNPHAQFLVLDYGSTDNIRGVLAPYRHSDQVVVYQYKTDGPFHVAHAKNMAARCAIREGADVLVTLDADNFAGPDFDRFVMDNLEPGTFLCPDHESIREMPWGEGSTRPLRGFAGRLAVRTQDFIKAGGYDETYDTWRGEDIDFNARMGRMGYNRKYIDVRYLDVIPHNAEVRFKEYPHAKKYDQVGAWKKDGGQTDTVVNYGKFGCGLTWRQMAPGQYEGFELEPVPTRIFGIGMHKTATTSLHKAFQILGFDSLHWGKGEAPLIWEEVNAAGRSLTLERFYSACDMPIPLLYQQLDKAYPGSKFILTIRDEQKWLRSVEKLWNPEYNPTRWQWDVWPISNRLHKAMYGRTDFEPRTMLETYRRHNAEVQKYFASRPRDLLIMNMEIATAGRIVRVSREASAHGEYPHEYKSRVRLYGGGSGI